MKKTYTKRQIIEAIAYWKKQLKQMTENIKCDLKINEVKKLVKDVISNLSNIHETPILLKVATDLTYFLFKTNKSTFTGVSDDEIVVDKVCLDDINIIEAYKEDPYDISNKDLSCALKRLIDYCGINYSGILYRGLSKAEILSINNIVSKNKSYVLNRCKSFTKNKDFADLYTRPGGASIGEIIKYGDDYINDPRNKGKVLELTIQSPQKIFDMDMFSNAILIAEYIANPEEKNHSLLDAQLKDRVEDEIIIPDWLVFKVKDIDELKFYI